MSSPTPACEFNYLLPASSTGSLDEAFRRTSALEQMILEVTKAIFQKNAINPLYTASSSDVNDPLPSPSSGVSEKTK